MTNMLTQLLNKINKYKVCNKSIKVLDFGEVKLIDWLGDDVTVTECARTSYKNSNKQIRTNDNLIDYLVRMTHLSPFEHIQFRFMITAPIFVIIHLIRHRTFKVSAESARYSKIENKFYIPEFNRILKQINKIDGYDDFTLEEQFEIINSLQENINNSNKLYNKNIDKGLIREIARVNMPVSQYMTIVVTADLRNLFNFFKQRLALDAQYETRVFADAMFELVRQVVPKSIESFEEHILYSKTISRTEWSIIYSCLTEEQRKICVDKLQYNFDIKGSRLNDFKKLLKVGNK